MRIRANELFKTADNSNLTRYSYYRKDSHLL